MSQRSADRQVEFGTTVYDEDGEPLGTVRGFDANGFYVTAEREDAVLSVDHERTDRAGEAELMWRCWECGEMGNLSAELPSSCPSCGADREELYYWTED